MGITNFIERMAAKKRHNKIIRAIRGGYSNSRTSISDANPYTSICERAVADDAAFENFKDHPDYVQILEHVPYEQGKLYLDIVRERWGAVLAEKNLDKFQTSEYNGGGKKYYFAELKRFFSPTTLRYIKTAAEIDSTFGLKNIKSIAEIGIGYGGQFKIIRDLAPSMTWTGVDLPQACALGQKWLDKTGCMGANFIDGTSDFAPFGADLLISNYAFSELRRAHQDNYFDKIIKNCPRGYMAWNPLSERGADGYTAKEFCDKIGGGGAQCAHNRRRAAHI